MSVPCEKERVATQLAEIWVSKIETQNGAVEQPYCSGLHSPKYFLLSGSLLRIVSPLSLSMYGDFLFDFCKSLGLVA